MLLKFGTRMNRPHFGRWAYPNHRDSSGFMLFRMDSDASLRITALEH